MPDSLDSREQPLDDTVFPPGIAFIDGRYTTMDQAKIPVLDWGFLRSDATYDVVHVWQGRFFRLDAHVERFLKSVEALRMTLPFGRAELERVLHSVVARAGFQEAYVEMVCTRGHSPSFSRDPRQARNRFFAFAIPFGWIASEEQRARGLDLHVAEIPRIAPESVNSTVKNYHWLDLVMGLYAAYDAGRENVVLTDGAGNVTEGPGFNLFAVKAGRVTTPGRGVLHGITRRTALELCAELGIPAEAAPLSVEALKASDEVFLTSTAGGPMPITRLDGRPVGDGRPGPVTAQVTELYWKKHADPAWTTAVDYTLAE